jgi:hypothetical protein
MGVTFVTALYLPSEPTYRKLETYIAMFELLAATGVPIILYLDTRLESAGKELVEKYPNIQKCFYGSADMSYVTVDVILPVVRNIQKDTADYFCIQLSKLRVLNDALEHLTTSHIAWIDFGIYHMFRDRDLCHLLLNRIAASNFPSDKILSPSCWDTTQGSLWDKISWRHCGSFLLGSPNAICRAYEQQMEIVMTNLPRLTWEVNYWAMMEGAFHTYKADHNDLLLKNICNYVCP